MPTPVAMTVPLGISSRLQLMQCGWNPLFLVCDGLSSFGCPTRSAGPLDVRAQVAACQYSHNVTALSATITPHPILPCDTSPHILLTKFQLNGGIGLWFPENQSGK